MTTNGPRKILIVDDEFDNRNVLHGFLLSLGYATDEAKSGVEAIAWLEKNYVDLVLLDLQMPIMDGIEVLRRLKNNSQHQMIPVIIVSAFNDQERIEHCISQGADDYLVKPFDRGMLKARIEGSFRRLEQIEDERELRKKMESFIINENKSIPAAMEKPEAVYVNDGKDTPRITPELDMGTRAERSVEHSAELPQIPISHRECVDYRVQSRTPDRIRFSRRFVGVSCVVIMLVICVFFSVFSDESDSAKQFVQRNVLNSGRETELASNKDTDGTFRLFAIGITKYRFTDRNGADRNLTYPMLDVEALAQSLKSIRHPSFFDAFTATILRDEEATRRSILAGLEKLRKESTPKDLVFIWFAGHGILDEAVSRFFFAPHDFEWDHDTSAVSGVSWDDIQAQIRAMPCHVVVVMDACHSGEITRNLRSHDDVFQSELKRFSREFRHAEKGRVVIAACLRQLYAEENKAWEHSALALATLETLSGGGLNHSTNDLSKSKILSLGDLRDSVPGRVRQLTDGRQSVLIEQSEDLDIYAIPIGVLSPVSQ